MKIINSLVKGLLGEKNVRKLRIKRFVRDNKEISEIISLNRKYKDRFQGKRCFIIGNGPSIKNIDFNILRDEYTFTVNQQSRNERFEQLNTSFHLWTDERFFDISEKREEDMELINCMKKVNTNGNRPVVFYRSSAYKMIKHFNLDKELDISYFEHISWGKQLKPTDYVDFSSPVPIFPTVIHYAICLAVYMGFKEIILLGCDCTGIVDIVHSRIDESITDYSYQISDNEKKRMQRVAQQTSIRDELIWYASLFDKYEELKNYCDAKNVKLVNATSPSLLECIPKVDFNSLFQV